MTTGPMRANVVPAAPVPPPISLLDMAYRPDAAPEVGLDGRPLAARWEAGFKWVPRQCAAYGGRDECSDPAVVVAYANADDPAVQDLLEHTPVILSADYPCASTLTNDTEFKRQSAVDTLVAAEPRSAELELWDGVLARAAMAGGDAAYASNRWLTKFGLATDVTPTPGTAVSVARGIGLLEDFLSDHGYGGQGMIHMRPAVTAHLPWDTRPQTRALFTARGTYLVPGAGYTGNGPAATSGNVPVAPGAGETWLYATDRVTYRQGPILVIPDDVSQAVDRRTNQEVWKAERSSAGTFDLCAIGAVLVSYPA